MAETIICPYCKTPNQGGDKFCLDCGRPLSGESTLILPDEETPAGNPAQDGTEPLSKNTSFLPRPIKAGQDFFGGRRGWSTGDMGSRREGVSCWLTGAFWYVCIGHVVCCLPAQAGVPKEIRLATGSEGGVYHVLGEGLAKAIERELDVKVVIRETKGSSENIGLLRRGEVDFALVQNDYAYRYNEEPDRHGDARESILLVASLYTEAIHVVVAKGLDVLRLKHLYGKSVRLGAVDPNDPRPSTSSSARACGHRPCRAHR